ncbi:hypothetical protein L3Y34_010546 [Caenorhabditis briggsae]|uniref:Uncharacterized protein n=1 Tax=Caenorhabditis briggsae TaxID=6238 RepID=A0AAE9CT78_CAEBR|nr:hypothetical protein L3Y34_010546 [Caenorhabditis briggsae]
MTYQSRTRRLESIMKSCKYSNAPIHIKDICDENFFQILLRTAFTAKHLLRVSIFRMLPEDREPYFGSIAPVSDPVDSDDSESDMSDAD